jgi:hypothetical protein
MLKSSEIEGWLDEIQAAPARHRHRHFESDIGDRRRFNRPCHAADGHRKHAREWASLPLGEPHAALTLSTEVGVNRLRQCPDSLLSAANLGSIGIG